MSSNPSPIPGGARTARRDLTWLVAFAASLWGLDALLRIPLTHDYSATTIVALEHVIIVLVTLPWVPSALRSFMSVSARTQLAVVLVGVGASAVATVLFTRAFMLGDPVTPVVLQKLQPLIAVLVAAILLKERLKPRFALFIVPALLGAWLLAFKDPFAVSAQNANAALMGVGAAALWGTGTVLGRLAGAELSFRDLTVLRFMFGLPASVLLALVLGQPMTVKSTGDLAVVASLALIPGLAAVVLYYVGLKRTPASRATVAELAYPATGAVVGVLFLGTRLDPSQWLGMLIVVVAVTGLALHERFSSTPAVDVPSPAREAIPSP